MTKNSSHSQETVGNKQPHDSDPETQTQDFNPVLDSAPKTPSITDDSPKSQDEPHDPTSEYQPRTRDFRFLPIPEYLQYRPDRDFHFGLALNIAFGVFSTFSKALSLEAYYLLTVI
jgi:hypothetical protein